MNDEAAPPHLTHVDLAAECTSAGVAEVLRELDRDLICLAPVKLRIHETAALLVDRARGDMGLARGTPTLHLSFNGNPGTGKTTVALKMAGLLHRLGYVRKGHLVSVTRDDLVDQYIGHTAPKTKEALKRPMGGILFIDEGAALAMADYVRLHRGQPHFANARSVRNALDRARLRQASRLFESGAGPLDAAALSTIIAVDIRGSCVFSGRLDGNDRSTAGTDEEAAP